VFVARLYASDSAEIEETTSGKLVHLLDWNIDLRKMPSFGVNAATRESFSTGHVFSTPSLVIYVELKFDCRIPTRH
jgi:hypothetical protein